MRNEARYKPHGKGAHRENTGRDTHTHVSYMKRQERDGCRHADALVKKFRASKTNGRAGRGAAGRQEARDVRKEQKTCKKHVTTQGEPAERVAYTTGEKK